MGLIVFLRNSIETLNRYPCKGAGSAESMLLQPLWLLDAMASQVSLSIPLLKERTPIICYHVRSTGAVLWSVRPFYDAVHTDGNLLLDFIEAKVRDAFQYCPVPHTKKEPQSGATLPWSRSKRQ